MKKLALVLIMIVGIFSSCTRWECYEQRVTNETTGEVTYYEICDEVEY
tara:strand:+ start:568 stop:711 length:144 start_codon:yes stop_codon:yes gene_type:complete